MELETRAVNALSAPPATALTDRAGGRHPNDGPEPSRPVLALPPEGERPYWLHPLLALVALILAFATLGIATYRSAKDSVTNAVAANLESVAKLKSLQIDHWLENAARGLKTAVDALQFTRALQDWENDGRRDGERRAQLQELLSRMAANSHYDGVELRSPLDGSLLLATNNNTAAADAGKSLAAVAANAPVLDGFHADEGPADAGVRLGYFYPCRPRGSVKALAVVHVELDPSDMLAQLTQEWPSLSRSAETLLVRRDGSDVVFLTRVRDLPGAKAMMRMPLARPDFVESAAVMGGSGYLSGLDYVEAAVLAYALQIDGTPWFIVAQIDQAEVYAKIREIAALAAAAVGALLVLVCGWWATRRRFLMARRRADLEVGRFETERADNLQRIAETSRRVVDVQETERRRLSGELHDLVGANLAAIDMVLATYVRTLPGTDTPGSGALLRDSRDLLHETINRVREFSSDLRPLVLDAAGIVPALKECGLRFTRRTGIPFDLVNDGFHGRLPTQIESVIYRIAQEALTNCAKHANASRVSARLRKMDGHLELSIADDGDGFESAPQESRFSQIGGLGLITMRERAEFVGGRLSVTSRPGSGTVVWLVFDDIVTV